MDRRMQDRAVIEILKGCDVIIASGKKGMIDKTGKALGQELHRIGLKPNETEALFSLVRENMLTLDDDSEIEVGFISYTDKNGTSWADIDAD